MRVYLAGTIVKDKQTAEWRTVAETTLRRLNISTRNPLRGKKPESISKDGLTSNIQGALFVARDLMDLRKSDVLLLVWLKGITQRQSIGTWCEMGIAMELGIPIIIVTDDPLAVDHPFVQEAATLVTGSLSEAINQIKWLDTPNI